MILKFSVSRCNFFDLFEAQVGHALEAACFFTEVTAQDHVPDEMLNRMAQIEHQGDDAAHTIIQQLNKTFLTPFDRQDIHALAMEVDDITDMIHNIVSRLRVYNTTRVDRNLVEFAGVIEQSVRAVARAIRGASSFLRMFFFMEDGYVSVDIPYGIRHTRSPEAFPEVARAHNVLAFSEPGW